MNQARIPKLLDELRRVSSSTTLRNPYESSACCKNLTAYLHGIRSHSFSGHLLVGEAPGHRGCALTGIPFTSQHVLMTSTHPFIESLRSSISVSGDVSEASATIVWDYLDECSVVPAMWNAFPFHPHKADNLQSNRTPSQTELGTGSDYLQLVLEILSPDNVVAVGSKSTKVLNRWFPDLGIMSVRHPSHGGKSEFLAGIKAAGIA